jgi:hypothetical protein
VNIHSVRANGRRRAFEVEAAGVSGTFPYAKCLPRPSAADPVVEVFVDPELGNEAFTYRLRSGLEGSVHVDQVREENRDPSYLRDRLLYQLTLEAQRRLLDSPLSKREIIRRLGTSAAQLYRILDQTNYAKSIDQVLRLLNVLDCDVQVVVRAQTA